MGTVTIGIQQIHVTANVAMKKRKREPVDADSVLETGTTERATAPIESDVINSSSADNDCRQSACR